MRLIYIISSYMHKLYFSQPYSFFLSRNSADLHRFVYTEVNFVVHNFFVPLFSCFQNLVIVVLLSMVVACAKPASGSLGRAFSPVRVCSH